MPYPRPTLSELIAQAQTDITYGDVGQVNAFLPDGVLPTIAMSDAGLAYGHYGYIDWISLQAVPWTATDEYLLAWGALVGVYPKAGTAAQVTLQVTNGIPGRICPAGQTFSVASGFLYTAISAATVDAFGNLSVTVLASQAGSSGNVAVGSPINFLSPVSGIPSTGTVTAVVPGADQETQDAYRQRVLLQYRSPPHGGAASDYVEWALSVPGVTRAWCNPLGMGPGTVTVYIMLDVSESAYAGFPQGTNGCATSEARGSPATADQLTVANYIYPLRPVTATVYVVSPIAQPTAFSLKGSTAIPSSMLSAVQQAIDNVFVTYNTPLGGTIALSPFETALSGIAGMPSFTLLEPSGPINTAVGYLATRGAVTLA